jgi:DNA-binding MarR family transcriptional regulator
MVKVNMSTNKSSYIDQIMISGEQMGVESVAFHAIAADKLGLHLSDMKALSILQQSGPLGSSKLAELSNLTPGAITSMVDRLAAQNFVHRVPDMRDARRVLIELDQQRMKEIQTLYGSMIAHMARLLESLNETELEIIATYQRSVVVLMREEALNLQTLPDHNS